MQDDATDWIQMVHDHASLTEAAIAAMDDATDLAPPVHPDLPPLDVVLPRWTDDAQVTLIDAIARRRTSRQPPDESLAIGRLSWLLAHAAGETAAGQRPHPSALAAYPLRLDVVALRCDGLGAGVHRYVPEAHGLHTTMTGDLAPGLAVAFGRDWVRRARVVLVISADLPQATHHTDARGYRYALLEAGHLAQNLLLLAAAADLPACPVGGFADRTLGDMVKRGDDEVVLYTVAL